MTNSRPVTVLLTTVLMLTALTGCNEEKTLVLSAQQTRAIESGDECHLCGMIIGNFGGPKGQLFVRGQQQTKKFCSTRDMFAFLLDPEHSHNIESVFVHDMAVTPWDKPEDDTYIDARQAWYVVGSDRKGAMGPTLASFADQQAAATFAATYHGQLYRFDQLNLELISSIGF